MLCLIAILAATLAGAADATPSPAPTAGAAPVAWWTGPLLAPGAGTLPPGGMLIEPYIYESISGHHSEMGSMNYLIYGVANRFSAGFLPGTSDSSFLAQYGLSTQHAGGAMPTSAVAFEETLPATNKLMLNTQEVFQTSSAHAVRVRLDTTFAFPNDTLSLDAAAEYNLNRRWVLATDAVYSRTSGGNPSYAVAPALEYNWSAALGVIAGVRYGIPSPGNPLSIAPVIAINYVH